MLELDIFTHLDFWNVAYLESYDAAIREFGCTNQPIAGILPADFIFLIITTFTNYNFAKESRTIT